MRLLIRPIDTWFFRDGTPFDMDAGSQTGARALFPPHPPTVVGALRAAIARGNGWDGAGRWPPALDRVLGDGPENTGSLRFTGPVLVGPEGPVFRCPRHVIGKPGAHGRFEPGAFVRPGEPVACDLGPSVRLPRLPPDRLEPGDGAWVTLDGLQRILRWELPRTEEVRRDDDLWAMEPRVGIARDPATRTVLRGHLYSAWHVRPKKNLALGMVVDGLPRDWKPPVGETFPVGGEGRMGTCGEAAGELLPRLDLSGNGPPRATLVALTPLLLPGEAILGREPLAGPGAARVASACLDRPLRIGGWDSLARRPLPLRSAAAPGTALFCELEDPAGFWEHGRRGLVKVGQSTAIGFGLCAVSPGWESTR
jgi:CRISPR-associated protein Cmr3